MADKAPGLEFSNYWTQFVQPPSAGSDKEGGGVLGNWLAGVLGGLKNPEDEKTSLPGNTQAYSPATNFPEVFNQQYDSPYAPAYMPPQPVVPPQSPTSLQGFVKTPQYSVPPMQPNYLQQAQNQIKLNNQMQPNRTIGPVQDNGYLPITNQIWKK
jgi:hypothetical protein